MTLFVHILIIVCSYALLPAEPTINDWAIAGLQQVLIVIFTLRSFREGLEAGRDIVWKTLAQTFEEKGIESVAIKRTGHGPL